MIMFYSPFAALALLGHHVMLQSMLASGVNPFNEKAEEIITRCLELYPGSSVHRSSPTPWHKIHRFDDGPLTKHQHSFIAMM